MNADLDKGTISTRRGTSFARGVTIDGFLEPDEVTKLYEKWDNNWGEPLMFRGGQTAITCEMVASVPLEKLTSTFGKKLGAKLLTVAQKNSVV